MRQRQPREKNKAHCDFIRSLPCLLCGDSTSTECAHIRMADRSIAKPNGFAVRPDDRFTVPLCGAHHRSQHESGERDWWLIAGIDPIKVALALWSVSGDYERGYEIVSACREQCAA